MFKPRGRSHNHKSHGSSFRAHTNGFRARQPRREKSVIMIERFETGTHSTIV